MAALFAALVAFPCLLIALPEIGLRISGYGHDT